MTEEKSIGPIYDTQLNIRITKEQIAVLDERRGFMSRSEFIRQLITEPPAIPHMEVDLSKLDRLEARLLKLEESLNKRLREQSKLFESFTNVVLEIREANRSMHENTTQSINLALQQNTNVLTALQTLHTHFDNLVKQIEELRK